MDRGDTAFGQSFIVFTVATIEAKPSEGALHHLTTGQYGETFLLLRAEDRLKAKAKTLTNPHSERVMQPAPGAIVPPLPEVGVNTLSRRKTTRQHPPLDATHSQVENGINHQTHIQAAWSPPGLAAGIRCWIIDHWLSVKSVGYRFVFSKTAYTTIWPTAFTIQTASER